MAGAGSLSRTAEADQVGSAQLGDHAKLALVAQYTDNPVIITDRDGRIEWVNQAFSRLTEYRLDEVVGKRPGSILQGPGTDPRVVREIGEKLRAGRGFRRQLLNYSKSGRQYVLELDVQPVRGADGAIESFIAIERDVTESGEVLKLALESARQGVWHWNAGNDKVVLSSHFLPLFGYDALTAAAIDPTLVSITHPDDRHALERWYEQLKEGRLDEGEIEYRIATASGEWHWIQSRGRVVVDSRALDTRRLIGIHNDITQRKTAEDQIRRMAYFDTLTGLPNRTLLIDRLSQSLSLARRNHTQLGVLFLDLDNFKNVNDGLGHEAGDRLLVAVATRVTGALRAESVVARLGGDEFVVLLPDLREAEEAAVTARRILEVLIESAGSEFAVTASIGIALFPNDGDDPLTLIKNADTAMYAAKDSGRNGFRFFTHSMNDSVMGTLKLETRLRQAIREGSFYLLYQPKVEARTGSIVGMEALIRWNDAELGAVPPNEFVPVAERHGLIRALGDWVLNAACKQNVAWQRAGLTPLPVAVNVSALDFDDPELPARIRRALQETGLEARYLEIELTESALMKDAERTTALLHEIKSLGVSIAIDDFGTGYSSLAYLGTFPIDRLKIDRSFVRDLPSVNSAAEITRAIIGIAKRLSLSVVAEGVETQDHAKFLQEEQCDDLQGYLFSRPLPAKDFEAMLRERAVHPA